MQMQGRKHEALFVGQWAPTLVSFALWYQMVCICALLPKADSAFEVAHRPLSEDLVGMTVDQKREQANRVRLRGFARQRFIARGQFPRASRVRGIGSIV